MTDEQAAHKLGYDVLLSPAGVFEFSAGWLKAQKEYKRDKESFFKNWRTYRFGFRDYI